MTHKKALYIFLLLQLIFFSPVIFKGDVIFPHDNGIDVGNTQAVDSYPNNRKFSDISRAYIPNLHQHLKSKSSLALWDNSTALGRPLGQLAGLSRAYILTNSLSLFTQDAFSLLTFYVLITVILGGLFFFFLLRTYKLSPETCLFGAVGISNGVFYSYWQTFPMSISLFTWVIGIMLFSRLCILRGGYLSYFALVFSSYSLLMTSGPQGIILLLYLFIPFIIVGAIHESPVPKVRKLLSIFCAGLAGLILSLPVYLDLFITTNRSARTEVLFSDYLKVLPKIESFSDLLRNFLYLFDISLFKTTDLPHAFNGHSFSVVFFALFIASFFLLRGHKLFKIYSLVCFVAAFSPTAYGLLFKYFGFHISRCTTLGGLVVPVVFLAAHVFEKARIKEVVVIYLVLISMTLFQEVNYYYLLVSFFMMLLLVAYFKTRKTAVFLLLLFSLVYFYAKPLTFFRPKDSIYQSSQIIEELRKATKSGQFRYAKVALKRDFLSSNQESLWGLKSIHANDSISSRSYQNLIASLSSQKTGYYGRISASLAPDADFDSEDFSRLGVSALISSVELQSQKYKFKKRVGRLYLYQSERWPFLVFPEVDVEEVSSEELIARGLRDEKRVVFSKQYHPNWRAEDSRGRSLDVFQINDFFLAVEIPAGVKSFSLKYESVVSFVLFSQLIFIFIVLLAFPKIFISHRNSDT